MKKYTTLVEAAVYVMKLTRHPMNHRAIVDICERLGLYRPESKDKYQTMQGSLHQEIKKGERSRIIKVDRGVFYLKGQEESDQVKGLSLNPTIYSKTYSPSENIDTDLYPDDLGPLRACGADFIRNNVDWEGDKKIECLSSEGGRIVNLYDHVGVYILYLGSVPVYVGRSDKGCIGDRLRTHTTSEKCNSWDRFSIYSMGISRDIDNIPDQLIKFSILNQIVTLEAVLIDVLNPKLNSKRGDYINRVRCTQLPYLFGSAQFH